jgi:anaerobic ribonucleoside-triphosphate reductase activating protein
MDIHLFSLAYPVTSLGPGERVVLWVAGCAKRCPGCISPEMRSRDSGKPVPTAVLARRILAVAPHLDGVTISGGEPFEQAEAIVELLSILLKERPDWNVVIYTGRTLRNLRRASVAASALLEMVDVLIDGPYKKDIPREHPLAGSGNQEVHYLTERALAMKQSVESLPIGAANLGLGKGGLDMIVGVTDKETRKAICKAFGARNLSSRAFKRKKRV